MMGPHPPLFRSRYAGKVGRHLAGRWPATDLAADASFTRQPVDRRVMHSSRGRQQHLPVAGRMLAHAPLAQQHPSQPGPAPSPSTLRVLAGDQIPDVPHRHPQPPAGALHDGRDHWCLPSQSPSSFTSTYPSAAALGWKPFGRESHQQFPAGAAHALHQQDAQVIYAVVLNDGRLANRLAAQVHVGPTYPSQ